MTNNREGEQVVILKTVGQGGTEIYFKDMKEEPARYKLRKIITIPKD